MELEVYPQTWATNGISAALGSTVLQNGRWYHIVAVYKQNQYTSVYVNGVLDGTNFALNLPVGSTSSSLKFGVPWWSGSNDVYFNGQMSNAQLYNTSLDSSQILTLYQEGIGGAPVAPSNVVGWWPLNGI